MKVKKYLFAAILFIAIIGCVTERRKFRGMWQLDKFETLDTNINKWQIDTTRLDYYGFILYDGLGHMGVQQTPAGYKNADINKNLDSLSNSDLKKLVRFYRSNYVYFADYKINDKTIEHRRLSATNPKEWGTTLKRDFNFIGDTLILTTYENVNGSKLRIRWIKLRAY